MVDGGWNTVLANEAAPRIFGRFFDPSALGPLAGNAMHVIGHPQGLRRFVVNWEEFAGPLMRMLHREAAAAPAAAALRDAVLAYPGMPAVRWRAPDAAAPVPPVGCMRLRRDDLALGFFSTLTMLATPRAVSLEQLRRQRVQDEVVMREHGPTMTGPRARRNYARGKCWAMPPRKAPGAVEPQSASKPSGSARLLGIDSQSRIMKRSRPGAGSSS